MDSGIDVRRARERLSANPGENLLLLELANRLRLNDEVQEALSWLGWASRPERWPDHSVDPRVWHLLAHVLMDLGRFDEAQQMYRRASADGADGRLRHSCARACLGQGDWRGAWSLAEGRWQVPTVAASSPPRPHWHGWPDVNQLTLWDEQGFGDTLQALRWLPAVMRQQHQVTLEVRAPLQRLLQKGLDWLGPNLCIQAREDHGWAGRCHGSLLSLPSVLCSQQWPDPVVVRLPQATRASHRRRIGLVWESGRYLDDPVLALEYRRKTLPAQHRRQLCDALKDRHLEVVLLQQGFDLDADADFLDQALLMQQCDLLLSVDTAAAHLGGVTGHPTWMLLPWAAASRWQRGSTTTELYPQMRLVRQPRHGDWDGLLLVLLDQLDRWMDGSDLSVRASNSA